MKLPEGWRRLKEEDLPELLTFCLENEAYFSYIRSTPQTETLRQQLTVLPTNTVPEQKFFIGLWEKNSLVAIADLIMDWPRAGVVYVGWFMVARALQSKGFGRHLEAQLSSWLKATGYHTLRLACVEDNLPGFAFWERCGFLPTGQRCNQDAYSVLLLEKEL